MKATSAHQLSHLLLESRKEHGLTQSDVAEKVGIRQDTVSKFENSPDGPLWILYSNFLLL
ncbi:helix-turn-helix domain-containing protein [Photobacterium lutimaris]|nr:helix-turn-helix domain-containing protein [Photobacterium lutimaris]TDR72607.1 helix-turn-helix protein [Photobacterium lutimaris]